MNGIVENIEASSWVPALDWSATVKRGLVHRVAVAEVLLTDIRVAGDARFVLAAQWPRAHCTFDRSGDGRHNPLLVAETLRQIGLCVPMLFYGVAPDAHFLIKDLAFDVDRAREPRAGYGATDVVCRARSGDVLRHPKTGAVRGMLLEVSFQADGVTFAEAGGRARFLSADLYQHMRGEVDADPYVSSPAGERPAPDAVTVPSAADVVVAVADDGSVHVSPADLRHPFFYDHFSDHVPGMVLLEAARQAVALRSGGRLTRPVGARLEAGRFTSPNTPALVECGIDGDATTFGIVQDGVPTATGMLFY